MCNVDLTPTFDATGKITSLAGMAWRRQVLEHGPHGGRRGGPRQIQLRTKFYSYVGKPK